MPSAGRLGVPSPASPQEPVELLPPTAELSPEGAPSVGAPDPTALRSAVEALEAAALASQRARLEEQRRWLWGALEIGLALARRVLERELAIDPSALRPLLERALTLLEDATPLEIALSPAAFETLEAEAGEAVLGLRARADVTFSADPALGAGEARVSSDTSRVDVRLDTLLSMLRDELVSDWEETT